MSSALKLLIILVAVLAVSILAIVLTGALLPQHHTATRTMAFNATPDQVFALISGPQDWRTDLKSYSTSEESGRKIVRETDKNEQTITYEIVQLQPPTLLTRRIADKSLPFGGSWTWRIEPQAEGCLVTIIEDGELYNPVFRFVSKFILGHTRTMDAYLVMLSNAVRKQGQH